MFIHSHYYIAYLFIILLQLWLLMYEHSCTCFLVKYFCHVYTWERNCWVIGNSTKQFSKVVVLIFTPNCNRWEFSCSIFIQDLILSVFSTLVICWVFVYLIAILICISFIITVFETVQNLCECVWTFNTLLSIFSHFFGCINIFFCEVQDFCPQSVGCLHIS